MKDRQSNFELLRLIAMLMVMACHAIGYVQGTDLIGFLGASRLVITQLCAVAVDVFVMISGWFGIKASWKGAAKLIFQVWFLAVLCCLVFLVLGMPVSFKKDLLPYLLFGSGYWFVVSYLILYALSPILNSFVEQATQKQFAGVLVAFFLAEFIFGYVLDLGHFDYGFSPLFFIGLYLLARYARLYPGRLFSFSKGLDFIIYLGISILSMLGFWLGYKWFGMGFHLNHYDSPLIVVSSLAFLLFFSKLKFYSEFINHLASSAFAIYLIHTHSLVYPLFKRGADSILANSSPLVSIFFLFVFIICSAGFCILIDKLRLYVWIRISPSQKHSSIA